jgi:hypothetical protein
LRRAIRIASSEAAIRQSGFSTSSRRPKIFEVVGEFEGWTNDRTSVELGVLGVLRAKEWVLAVNRRSNFDPVWAFKYCRPNGTEG